MQTITYNVGKKIGGALTELRKQKHKSGFPFMVVDKDFLPDRQAYMEYQDGKVEVVEFTNDYNDYYVVRVLDHKDAINFRLKYQLD